MRKAGPPFLASGAALFFGYRRAPSVGGYFGLELLAVAVLGRSLIGGSSEGDDKAR